MDNAYFDIDNKIHHSVMHTFGVRLMLELEHHCDVLMLDFHGS
jgi:hypothetical protein